MNGGNLWIPAYAGMTGVVRCLNPLLFPLGHQGGGFDWHGHPPLTSLRSFAPLTLREGGIRPSPIPSGWAFRLLKRRRPPELFAVGHQGGGPLPITAVWRVLGRTSIRRGVGLVRRQRT